MDHQPGTNKLMFSKALRSLRSSFGKPLILGAVAFAAVLGASAPAYSDSNNSGIGLVLVEALRRVGLSDPGISFDCSSSMQRDDLYTVTFYEPDWYHSFQKTSANYSCEEVAPSEIVRRHPCVRPALHEALAQAEAVLNGPMWGSGERVRLSIYSKNGLSHFQETAWLERAWDYLASPAQAQGSGDSCELGVRVIHERL